MNTLIEVPLWALLILTVLALPTSGALGTYLGKKVGGPILVYGYYFFIGQKIYYVDPEGNKYFKRVRGLKAIRLVRIMQQLNRISKNDRS